MFTQNFPKFSLWKKFSKSYNFLAIKSVFAFERKASIEKKLGFEKYPDMCGPVVEGGVESPWLGQISIGTTFKVFRNCTELTEFVLFLFTL